MAKVTFTFNGIKTTTLCSKDDKMKDICLKYSTKIDTNINSLYFLYGGNQVNLNLTFEEQANSMDKDKQEMNILVYQLEKEGIFCQKCGELIQLDSKLIENIFISNNDLNDILAGIKGQLENIIDDILNKKAFKYIDTQLKNIIIIINNAIIEIKKNNEKIYKLKDMNQCKELIQKSKCNIIEGVLDIKVDEITNGVILFNKRNKDGIYVYLNDIKINMINQKNNRKLIIILKKMENINLKWFLIII